MTHTLLLRRDPRRADTCRRTAETNAHLYFLQGYVPFFSTRHFSLDGSLRYLQQKAYSPLPHLVIALPIVLHAGIFRTTDVREKQIFPLAHTSRKKQGRKPTCFSARRHSVRIRVALDLSSTFPRLTFHFFSTLVLSGHLVVIKRPHVRPRFFTSGANLCPPPSTTYPRRLTHLETTGPSRYFVKGRPPRFPHQGSSRFQYARIASHPGTTDYVRPRASPFPGHGGERYPLAKGRVQTMPLPPPHKKHPPH